jgi:NAD(P)-dependent dehydrogenase (short-subunit alcohol dehydrogenase family)
MQPKVWFITGTSRGFGRVWAKAALSRGDRVVATARDVTMLHALREEFGDAVLPLALDVTDRAAVESTLAAALVHFSHLDVVVNNAGYGLFGTVEEVTEDHARAQFETNLYGALWVTQAAIPILRAQGHGHIVQVSSISGTTAFPTLGLYNASKWALEGLSQALAAELAGFGIRTTLVEPMGYATDWPGVSAVHSTPIAAYDALRAQLAVDYAAFKQGDPNATAGAILALVDAEDPPLRLFLGSGGLDLMRADYESRLNTWEQWAPVSEAAQG